MARGSLLTSVKLVNKRTVEAVSDNKHWNKIEVSYSCYYYYWVLLLK